MVFSGRFASPGLQAFTEELGVGPPYATRLPTDVQIRSLAQTRIPRCCRPWRSIDPHKAVEKVHDTLACTILLDISADIWGVAPLDPLPCPITVAWSEKDTLLPMAQYASALPELLPQATFKVLPGVGHEPMIDDPRLVAQTILAATGA